MFVCGDNTNNQLDTKSNEESLGGRPIINPHIKFHIDPSSMLSFSTYCDHTVWITHDGKAYAIGYNSDGRICGSLRKEIFMEDREVIFKDKKGQPFKFISVVCGECYTLYLVSSKSTENNYQLVYCYKNDEPLLFDTIFSSPISLFGSNDMSGAIDSSGRVIVIKYSVFGSPKARIELASLPSGDRAVKLALCYDFVISLGSSGRVCESKISRNSEMEFKEIEELRKETVVDVAGCNESCFVVLSDGRVFGRGNNKDCCLCLPEATESVSTFTFIDALSKYKIVSAFIGGFGAFFKTDKSEMIVGGKNNDGRLFVPLNFSVYPPVKVDELSDFNFCVAGFASAVFVGIEPPKNIANKKIEANNIENTAKKTKQILKVTPDTVSSCEISSEIERLRKEVSKKKEENLKLREENSKLREENSKLKGTNTKYEEEISTLKSELEKIKQEKKTTPEGMRSNGSLNKQTIQILGDSEMSELEKVKKIGRGATSEVSEVVQKKRFALKVLDVEFLKKKIQEEGSERESDEETKSKDDDYDEEKQNKIEIDINKLKQFVKESEVLNQLDHKNIVKMFGFFFGNDHQEPAILLEYCESNLKRRVKKLSKEDRRRIIVELSSAMKEVHRVGIIHRDLKLENILLDSKNRVKVSDFGLCTFIKSDNETMSHTQMAGSLKYMAPEILQGRTDYDEKVDVYSFGVVVFLILTKGEFPSINVVDVGTGKQAQIPSNISEFSRKLILDCWSFKSKDRPSFYDIVSRLRGNEDKLI